MELRKKCFCCDDRDGPVHKKLSLIKSNDEKVLRVSVIPLGEDNKLEKYIKENNIKTDFKTFESSSANRNVKDSLTEKNPKNHSSEFSSCSKLKIEEVLSESSSSCDFTGFDDCLPLVTKKSDGIKSTNTISDMRSGKSEPVVMLENCTQENNNVETILNKNTCYVSKRIVKGSRKRGLNRAGNHRSKFSNSSKLSNQEVSINSNVSNDFIDVEECLPVHVIRPNDVKSSSIISDLGPSASDVFTSDETLKENGVSSDSLLDEVNINDIKKIEPCSASNESKVEDITQKSFNKIPVASVSPEDKTELLEKASADKSSEEITSKQKISPEIEEPLSLITKLTGYQVLPSKVKVLPLTPCISSIKNDVNDSALALYNSNNESSIEADESLHTHSVEDVSSHSNGNKVCFEVSFTCNDGNNTQPCDPEKLKRSKDEVRTVYDVMEYVSVLMPSWNLHILSDSNTFCICQVTRSANGVPKISKCIELDEHFNGKVHVGEKHLQRFDGVYNNEDAVVDLIKKINKIH